MSSSGPQGLFFFSHSSALLNRPVQARVMGEAPARVDAWPRLCPGIHALPPWKAKRYGLPGSGSVISS